MLDFLSRRLLSAVALPLAVLSSGAAMAQQSAIRIGVLAPITGPLATPGAEMLNGMKMFLSLIHI